LYHAKQAIIACLPFYRLLFLSMNLSAARRLRCFPILFALLLIVVMTGCGRNTKDDTMTPVEPMYEKAHRMMERGNWFGALAEFKKLIAQYPYGPHTEQAMIEMAYAHYKMAQPEEAISSIDRFIRTYPTHDNIAYLYYLRGLVNSNSDTVFLRRIWSLDASRRDLSTAHQAYADFGIVNERYSTSRYAADARERMLELRDVFAHHEMDNALYYLRRGAWLAAASRASYLLETWPQSAFQHDAIAALGEAYTQLGNQTLAADARALLQQNQPNHPWLHGRWPQYPWALRKLNPFAGERSAATGQRNARVQRK